MTKFKSIVAVLMTACCLFVVFASPASAAYVNTGTTISRCEGGVHPLGVHIGCTGYDYKVFQDNAAVWAVVHPLDVCLAKYHVKNTGTSTLTYSIARTYYSETAVSFSQNLGGGADAGLISLVAEKGFGLTQTFGFSVTASGSVGQEIPAGANTGYYKLTICSNYNKLRLDKYQNGTGPSLSVYENVPYGYPYVATLYSQSSDFSNMSIWGT